MFLSAIKIGLLWYMIGLAIITSYFGIPTEFGSLPYPWVDPIFWVCTSFFPVLVIWIILKTVTSSIFYLCLLFLIIYQLFSYPWKDKP